MTLYERPFDINDGERYVITIKSYTLSRLVWKRENGEVKFTNNPNLAKTFGNLSSANKYVNDYVKTVDKYQGFEIIIYQVKDLFKPGYKIVYNGASNPPELFAYPIWVYISEMYRGFPIDQYLDYDEAIQALNEKKKLLVEYYYKKITDIRNVELNKI